MCIPLADLIQTRLGSLLWKHWKYDVDLWTEAIGLRLNMHVSESVRGLICEGEVCIVLLYQGGRGLRDWRSVTQWLDGGDFSRAKRGQGEFEAFQGLWADAIHRENGLTIAFKVIDAEKNANMTRGGSGCWTSGCLKNRWIQEANKMLRGNQEKIQQGILSSLLLGKVSWGYLSF